MSCVLVKFACLCALGFQGDGGSGAAWDTLALEAEIHAVREGGLEVVEDRNASNGRYVVLPEGSEEGGFVKFRIRIPETGRYAVWGRISSADPQSDSFFVIWHPRDPEHSWAEEGRVNEFYWDLDEGPGWSWQVVTGMIQGERRVKIWSFEAGTETMLQVHSREARAKLDALFITRNTEARTPEAAGVRLPTEEDRRNQQRTQRPSER